MGRTREEIMAGLPKARRARIAARAATLIGEAEIPPEPDGCDAAQDAPHLRRGGVRRPAPSSN